MDEPTGNIDSKTASEIMELIKALNRESGVTIIMVTHDQKLAAETRHTVQLFDGALVQDKLN